MKKLKKEKDKPNQSKEAKAFAQKAYWTACDKNQTEAVERILSSLDPDAMPTSQEAVDEFYEYVRYKDQV
jgi:hypothetical protein